MTYGRLAACAMALGCTMGHAQTALDLHPPVSRLPGGAPTEHFHFERDQATRAPQWASNLGQGVVRAVALKYRMTSGPLVQYGSPDRDCGFDREDPSCP